MLYFRLNCIDFAYDFKLHFFALWKRDINFIFELVSLIFQGVENVMDKSNKSAPICNGFDQ